MISTGTTSWLQTAKRNAIPLLQLATVVVGIAMVTLASAGIVLLFIRLQQLCTAPLEVCARTMQLMPSNLAGIESPAAWLHFHAAWRAGLNTLVRLI